MKKLILSLILGIVLQSSLLGQIKVKGFIEIGYFDGQTSISDISDINVMRYDNAYYSDIVLTLSLQNIHLEQQLYNIFGYEDGPLLTPYNILYKTRVFYKWKYLKVGYEHMCLHPIIDQQNEMPPNAIRGSHDKIFIRYTFNAD